MQSFVLRYPVRAAVGAVRRGRVYVGPIAGWFVEAHGWPLFYLFSIAAALPGLLLLGICRQTLEHTQQHGDFMPRTEFSGSYRWALRLLTLGCSLLGLWLLLLIANALDWTQAPLLAERLLQAGAALSLLGVAMGSALDYRPCAAPVWRNLTGRRFRRPKSDPGYIYFGKKIIDAEIIFIRLPHSEIKLNSPLRHNYFTLNKPFLRISPPCISSPNSSYL